MNCRGCYRRAVMYMTPLQTTHILHWVSYISIPLPCLLFGHSKKLLLKKSLFDMVTNLIEYITSYNMKLMNLKHSATFHHQTNVQYIILFSVILILSIIYLFSLS